VHPIWFEEQKMENRAVVIHGKKDLRIEPFPLAEMGEGQVMVRIRAGGICGSDLHYYHDAGFGKVRLKEPMAIGHEVSGEVEAVGSRVSKVRVGDRVALNPSRPCGRCVYCQSGLPIHCMEMAFYGSAIPFPHSQGAFRERIVAGEFQCEPVGDRVSFGEAACAEPLAVSLHAVSQPSTMVGKRVLVSGSGPIGALVTASARYAGAVEVVATDLQDAALRTAQKMGAARTLNVSSGPGLGSDEFTAGKGYFDLAFECTGAPRALCDLQPVVKPRGTIVQLGVSGEVPIHLGMVVGKEIRLIGSHRFHSEYALAARLLREGRIDVKPIITATFPFERAVEALECAGDRSAHIKVQLVFGGA
jgi:L-idonate 5-dehydrogenase